MKILFSFDRLEPAHLKASSALYASRLVYNVRLLGRSAYALHGAIACAGGAADAFYGINLVIYQRLALLCRAAVIFNVGELLLAELLERTEHRVGCGTPKPAKRSLLHQLCKPFQCSKVFELALARRNAFENLKHAS